MPPHAHSPHTIRDPKNTTAYLVGAGIASLSAAVTLLQSAHLPPSQIHILESSPLPGGSMDGSGTPETGYILRGGRMLNFSYLCTYDLLSTIPSLSDKKKSVKDEIDEFNAKEGNKTNAHARLVGRGGNGKPEIIDVKEMGLNFREREDLIKVALSSEKSLGAKRIDECFQKEFFETKFWFMWDTMFAFEPWHSAVEFKRYLHRFLHEFPRINTLAGVDRTPYNQYDSIILPIETYLKEQGVQFHYETKVTSIEFTANTPSTISELHTVNTRTHATGIHHIHPVNSIVLLTLGSMTSSSTLGTNTKSPPLPSLSASPSLPNSPPSPSHDGSWSLWHTLASPTTNPTTSHLFGNPLTFTSRPNESTWLSFTTTLTSPSFLTHMETFTTNPPGTGALVTFKNSPWLMSIVIPHQPHFIAQPENIQVFWGYGLFPFQKGTFVPKKMSECSGSEILTELLGHLAYPASEIKEVMEHSITIPCLMPYITAQFLTRKEGDRPRVFNAGLGNVGLLGQFVEMEGDTVFTVEYSVRSALVAVKGLMGLGDDKLKIREIYKGERDVKVLMKALETLLT